MATISCRTFLKSQTCGKSPRRSWDASHRSTAWAWNSKKIHFCPIDTCGFSPVTQSQPLYIGGWSCSRFLFFLNAVLEPYGLKILGQAIGLMGLFGLLVQPLINLFKFFNTPGRMNQVKRKNLTITVAILAVFIAFVAFVPLPYNVKCAVEVKPNDELVRRIIVRTPGRLDAVEVALGQQVQKDDVIAKIVDVPLQLEYEEAKRQGAMLEQQWESLRAKKRVDPTAAADIYPVKRALESNARLLKNLEFRLGNLTLTAPVDGVVLPPPEKKEDPKVDGHLPSWHGSLLRKENNGARVEMDDVVCLVGDPGAFEAMLVIDQSDIPFVQEDLEAMIRFGLIRRRNTER